jgi:Domain of unknown function (DUF4192)
VSPARPTLAGMTSTDRSTARMNTPAELIAALPYLLGFHPRESLVLVATRGRTGGSLGLTLRVDLPPARHRRVVADAAASNLMLDAPEGAAVIVVAAGSGPPARPLVDRVVAELERRHVTVHTVIWAESTTSGARWGCYDPCGCGGELPDPATTVAVVSAVAGGQVALADRDELARLVAPADAAAIRRREKLLVAAHDDVDGSLANPSTAVAVVDEALADTAEGRLVLDDDRVVALALALADPLVRDTAMARCAGGAERIAVAAEQLWAALAREMPDPEAAEPAALLAVSAMLRGHGALAVIALGRAEQAWPGHRLTGLLRQATDAGMRPAAFRECLGLDDIEDIASVPTGRLR